MKKIELIQEEVNKFNEQHEMCETITARPAKIARENADNVVEEQTKFIHFELDNEEWEIIFYQHRNGDETAYLQSL